MQTKANDQYYEVINKNKICVEDTIEIISPRYNTPIRTKIIGMKNVEHFNIKSCPTPMSKLYLQFDKEINLDYPDIGRII